MTAQTRSRRFSQRTIRQVRLDANRSLIRNHFCPDRSEVLQLRCIEERPEFETQFGSQLWYFEGTAVDETDRRRVIFGAIEYSLQYGLHEVVDDGVFESEQARGMIRQQYFGLPIRPSLRMPAHRLLLLGVILVALAYIAYWAAQLAT